MTEGPQRSRQQRYRLVKRGSIKLDGATLDALAEERARQLYEQLVVEGKQIEEVLGADFDVDEEFDGIRLRDFLEDDLEAATRQWVGTTAAKLALFRQFGTTTPWADIESTVLKEFDDSNTLLGVKGEALQRRKIEQQTLLVDARRIESTMREAAVAVYGGGGRGRRSIVCPRARKVRSRVYVVGGGCAIRVPGTWTDEWWAVLVLPRLHFVGTFATLRRAARRICVAEREARTPT